MAQMNVRLDDDLRVQGNLAFESIGWSPSQAVRTLWAYAAKNRRDPRQLKKSLEAFLGNEGASTPKQEARRALVLEGQQIVPNARARLGISSEALSELPSYEELREEAVYERWQERGLL
ncbi:MAG: type II toxin-antitoxin system RelB/DinJ family antitoxin [Eggerthellaceae bacterium]|nr:type II toxin-antitoxin system RelB/DinJ family antitoxin [Eggerthellaceae bacterium]